MLKVKLSVLGEGWVAMQIIKQEKEWYQRDITDFVFSDNIPFLSNEKVYLRGENEEFDTVPVIGKVQLATVTRWIKDAAYALYGGAEKTLWSLDSSGHEFGIVIITVGGIPGLEDDNFEDNKEEKVKDISNIESKDANNLEKKIRDILCNVNKTNEVLVTAENRSILELAEEKRYVRIYGVVQENKTVRSIITKSGRAFLHNETEKYLSSK